jgi:peptide/nickel transport system substrate-binding protein
MNCSSPENPEVKNEPIRIAITSEPDALNPVTSKTIDALAINQLLFQKLLDINPENLELAPVLAENLPQIALLPDSNYKITYTIREEAKWNDGLPVTGKDVVFTMKTAVLSGIKNEGKRDYLNTILNVETDSADPRRVFFTCKPGMRMIYATGAELGILPKHIYDPNSALDEISFKSVALFKEDEIPESLKNFASAFNELAQQRDPLHISGSGPYTLQGWNPGQQINLEKTPDWWGNSIDSKLPWFQQRAEKLNFFIITEPKAIVSAAKNKQLDVGPVVRSKDYQDLLENAAFNQDFNLMASPELSVNVLLINACNPILADINVRKALAHLFNVEEYINTVQNNRGERIIGPLHPSKPGYHSEIEPYPFNLEKANELLTNSGWIDSDEDGVREKIVDGKKTDLVLQYKYHTGHEGRKNAGLLLKQWASEAGILVEIDNQEWLVFIEHLMGRNFELAFFSWTDEHAPTDPSTLYHSTAIDNGYNFNCYRSSRADSLVDALSRSTSDKEYRQLWLSLQELLHHDVPNLFLSTNETRYFSSKNLSGSEPIAIPPGYWAGSLAFKKTP